MKKIISVLLMLAVLFSFAACGSKTAEAPAAQQTAAPAEAPAAQEEAAPAEAEAPAAPTEPNAYVTITVAGTVAVGSDGTVMAKVPVIALDTNGNSIIDVDDVLTAAHAAYCPGGYASEDGDYGLSITKLWNDESFAFGYYVDNNMASSLTDEVAEGGTVTAYVFADKENYTDIYCYFDSITFDGSEVSLVLNSLSFDESWNLVAGVYEGATIAMVQADGTLVAIDDAITDAEGKVTFAAQAGDIISVIGLAEQILVPAVAVIG